jgi:perosamine synthetase
MAEFIPVNEPLLDGNESAYLLDCVESGWISSEGAYVERLEAGLAAYVGRAHGVAVTSGSAALELAVEALGIGAGDEVIIPTFTIISCAAPIVRRGAIPVVVDADPNTWTMDVTAIEALVTPRTKAIMAVHIYGLPVDMDPLVEVAARHSLAVIEDAAEAHGLAYRGRQCGSFGDISIFSFYPNKHITTGEGGMALTDNWEVATRCRSLRNLCFQAERRFVHEELGYNYRMSNLQAALGVAQLERLEPHLVLKRALGRRYTAALEDCPGLTLPLERTDYAENGYWVYGIVLDDDVPYNAATFAAALAARGIGTRPFFYPMHLQPVFRTTGLYADTSCPVAERLAERGLYLPSGLALTPDQVDRVAAEVRALLTGAE